MINIDTKEMRECGQKIMKKSTEINEIINELFFRIANMPVNTREWIGTSANEFVRKVSIQKRDYINIKNNIYNYGYVLAKNADAYDREIKRVGR